MIEQLNPKWSGGGGYVFWDLERALYGEEEERGQQQIKINEGLECKSCKYKLLILVYKLYTNV